MGFGFAKGFVICLALAIIYSIYSKSFWSGFLLIAIFVIIKSVWRLFTR